MESVTISELKNRLSAYLQKVRAGETIVILDRDTAIARLEAVPAGLEPDARLQRLERQGLLRRAREPVPMELLRSEPPAAARSVLEALVEERRVGR
jgi:antitoxin (DNA-binding transcriptional repressor) of toxin-antitoxin stability system